MSLTSVPVHPPQAATPEPHRRGAARVRRVLALLLAPLLACGAAASPRGAGAFSAGELSQGYRDGVVLARPSALALATIDAVERGEGLRLQARFERFGNVGVLHLAPGDTVPAALARLRATGRYAYVEPDYIRHARAVPDDPGFENQWALHNTGSGGGIAGADINAEAGWDTLTSAASIVVGIVDSGALTTHEDLVKNMWMNPHPGTTASYATISESSGAPETLSETDSANGLNAVAMSGLPTDDLGHGTHVSGIVGAVGDNGLGVAGVAWKVQLLELKFIDSSDNGSTSAELVCIDYAIQHGVSVINASYGSQGFSQAEMDAIREAGKSGIIYVCAAGNAGEDNDISGFYPADYPLDNIIAVGASDNRDLPVYFSNYGSGSVSIFAPGDNVYSTYNSSDSAYVYLSGTSMAAPFVTGTVALLRSQYPGDSYRETINRILNAADTNPGLAGKCMTGGRLDLAKALTSAASTPPNALFAHRTPLVGLDPYTCTSNVDSPAALESGTPQIAGTGGSHSLWWQWTAPENATVEIDTSGSDGGTDFTGGSTYATLLGVYTGTSLSGLTPVASSANFGTEPLEGGGSASYSKVTFHTVAGATYQINVQGQSGESGQTVLAINTDPDNNAVASPLSLAGPSASVLDANANAAAQGAPAILGTSGGHSLWYAWTPPFSGPAQVSAYSYDFVPAAAVYTGTSLSTLVLVGAEVGSVAVGTTTAVSQCKVAFTAAAGTTYLIQVDGETAQDIGEFTVSVDDSQWQALTQDAVTCSPAVGPDGTVYVGSNDNTFYAYGPGRAVKWSHAGGSVFDTSSAAVGPDGSVYAGCADGKLYAFSPFGLISWTYTVPTPSASSGLDNGLSSSPALASDGTVYFHDDDGNLYALNSAGTLKWTAAVPGVSYAAPTVAPDGTIYVGTDGGVFDAFAPSGSVKWSYTAPVAGEEIYTAAAIDAQGNVYFATLSGNIYSLTPAGALRWSFATGGGVTSAPALANGAVYFGGYDGNLYSLSAASGSLNWKYALGTQVRASAPAVDASGLVYIGCYDHNVYAITTGGTLARIYATDDIVRSSPVISGSMLYFGSEDHKVYAFSLPAGPAASDWPMYQFDAQRPGRAVSATLGITDAPSSQTVLVGAPLTLTVGAVGPGALGYQWSLNGAAIAGATASSYTIASATAADAGSYTVTVTSGSGSVTSAAAVVTVAASLPARLVNISTRALVGTAGNIAIAGIAISGPAGGRKEVLIRGVGPALGLKPFDLAGTLAAPMIEVFDSTGTAMASDAGWGNAPVAGTSAVAATFQQATEQEMSSVGAFTLGAETADSAMVAYLPPGNYTVQLSGVGATTGIGLVEVYEMVPSDPEVMTNISTRAQVEAGGDILIGGIYIGGTQPATLLVRGIGPALGIAPFYIAGVLAQPILGVYDSGGTLIASDEGWGNAPTAGTSAVSASFRAATKPDLKNAGAFGLTAGSPDCAMVITLPPGAYTTQVTGAGAATGIGLVEVYLLQ